MAPIAALMPVEVESAGEALPAAASESDDELCAVCEPSDADDFLLSFVAFCVLLRCTFDVALRDAVAGADVAMDAAPSECSVEAEPRDDPGRLPDSTTFPSISTLYMALEAVSTSELEVGCV